ncbi:hypothetical protein PV08_12104 [Exophiala spinifera]|uniref:Deacetylase sirtuin-type domain-containing protein n=1 Tax=Exophiala spinifera TaxID=91928 RepID=A0A0D2AT17_9EURO|nr:uncharacterized protein PV08_12104 [Exophiala spinifera]KIW09645.1 hypothetical protein PV08_12104 [Exophiala spinifera]
MTNSLTVLSDRTKLRECSSFLRTARVVVVTGAGISRSCGIPDFRSPGGLFSQTAEEAISTLGQPGQCGFPDDFAVVSVARGVSGKDLFQVDLLRTVRGWTVFMQFTAALYTRLGALEEASATHWFLRCLHDRGQLIRCYTQNIDGLEARVGLSTELTEQTVSGADGMTRCPIIQLHGDVRFVRCTICDHRSSWTDEARLAALKGDTSITCPRCLDERHNKRRALGKRVWACGSLRPDILLYGETHSNDVLLQLAQENDDGLRPTALLIMGSALRVPGCKDLVKRFANMVSKQNGRVISVNPTRPSPSLWGQIIDDHFSMECDDWVGIIQDHWADDGDTALGDRDIQSLRVAAATSKGRGGRKKERNRSRGRKESMELETPAAETMPKTLAEEKTAKASTIEDDSLPTTYRQRWRMDMKYLKEQFDGH